MHYLDIVILIIIIVSAIEGGVQGFIYEISSLIGLVAGFFLALYSFEAAADMLSFIPLADWILKIIAFLIILMATNLIFRIAGAGLRKLMKALFMGWFDRSLGVIFGLIRGAAFVVFVTVILLVTPLSNALRDMSVNTKLLPPSIQLAEPFIEWITEDRIDLRDAI